MKRIILLLLFILCTTAFSGELITCKVIRVIDGDTVSVNLINGTAKIRLYGIDAPESKQEYGKQSTKQEQVKKSTQEERQYWLNTKSYKKHNSSCRYFGNTKNGRYCTKDEGSACGICGG